MIYGNDPTRMDILFETDLGVDNDSNHIKIHFDQSGVSCSRNYYKMVIDNKSDRRLWTFGCSGFQPNSHYSFTIHYREYASSVIDYCWYSDFGWFKTASPSAEPKLAFYGYGDTRAYGDTSNVEAVAKAIYQHHNSHNNEGAFIIHSGDIVPDGGNTASATGTDRWQKSFWEVGTVDSMLRQLPIFTTIGNHDFYCPICDSPDNPLGCGDCNDGYINYQNTLYEYTYQPHYYYRYFKYPMYHDRPSGSSDLGNFYYAFDWGPARFFSLTSYPMVKYCTYSPSLDPDSKQYKWLESELAKDDYGHPWKIVYMHAPPYDAAGGSGCNMRQIRDQLIPLFKKYGVDLVLTGHEHYYGRVTKPTPSDLYEIKEGITYMVLGGGGATLANKANFCCPGDMDVADNTKYHFAYYEIDGDVMTVHVIDKDGHAFDTFTIDRTPIANFRIDGATTGDAPFEVQFENLSTGHVEKYEWDFGDGTTSTEKSPTHVYQNWGYYTVSLKLDSGLAYDTMTKQDYIRVGSDADFSAYPNKGVPPLTVTFVPNDSDSVYNLWDFGDGTTIEASGIVTHTYEADHYGSLTVAHTVGDELGNRITKTKSDSIKVEPYADFSMDVDPSNPYVFYFHDKSRGGGGVFSYEWSFGDQSGSGEQNPEHDYTFWGPDILDVTLSVVFNDLVNGQALRDEMTRTIKVPAPDEFDADFSASTTKGLPPLTVKFTPSTDYLYNYWDFGDGTGSSDNGTVAYTYSKTGTYTVTHAAGYPSSNTTMAKQDYINVALHAGFSTSPSRGPSPLTVEFTPTTDYPYHSWDFGDGTTIEASGTVSHNYGVDQNGSFTIVHTVGNEYGKTTLIKPDFVKVEPYADFRIDVDPHSIDPNPYIFQFYDESRGGGGVFSYGWSFGDQTGSVEQNPVHDYTFWGPGPVEVTLHVVFNDLVNGQAIWDNTSLTIELPFVDEFDAGFYASTTGGQVPLTVLFTPSSDYSYNEWDFGDGSYSLDAGSVPHTYTLPGIYSVQHFAGYGSENFAAHTEVDYIHVLDARFSADKTTGALPLTVEFTPSWSDAAYSSWDFGDGTTLESSGIITHTYETNGQFTITHTVGDDSGYRLTKIKQDYIKIEPYAAFTYAVKSENGSMLTIQFTNISMGDDLTYHWDFGDGGSSTKQGPTHKFHKGDQDEDYTVVLTVTDANDKTDSYELPVHVAAESTFYLHRLYMPIISMER